METLELHQPVEDIVIVLHPAEWQNDCALRVASIAAMDYNIPVTICTKKQREEDIAREILIAQSGIHEERLRGGEKYSDEEREALNKAVSRMMKAPIYVKSEAEETE